MITMKEMIIETLSLSTSNPIAFILYLLGTLLLVAVLVIILDCLKEKLKDTFNKKANEDKQDDQKIEFYLGKRKRRDLGENYYYMNRLFNELLFYCYEHSINIHYIKPTNKPDLPFSAESDTEDASAYIAYTHFPNSRIYNPHDIYIKLNGRDSKPSNTSFAHDYLKASNTVLCLAHEVGHAISMTEYHDSSEEGADLEAYKFCKNLMEPEEEDQLEIKCTIDCFFGGSKDYKHPIAGQSETNGEDPNGNDYIASLQAQKEA